MKIKSLIDRLHETLVSRKIEQGKQLLNKNASILSQITPELPLAPRAFYVLTGWAEYSEQAANIARKLDLAYRVKENSSFSHRAVCEIIVGKASLALYEGKIQEVRDAWQLLESHARHFHTDVELLATMNFGRARGEKKQAQYSPALELIRSAIQQYEGAQMPGMVAACKATEGWLLSQLGDKIGAAQSWEAAFTFLQNSEDWTLLANIKLFEARGSDRAGQSDKALVALHDAAELFNKCVPPHRSLRRVLLEIANLKLRLAYRERDKTRAAELSDSAELYIENAEKLLQRDPGDMRNSLRLLISMANKYMCGSHRSLSRARGFARKAYELAEKDPERPDTLMQARACYKQGVIESRAAKLDGCEDPVERRLISCWFARKGLELASSSNSDRLKARLHALLGNLFLTYPLQDEDYACSEWEAAMECMARHQEDRDYVAQEIEALGRRLKQAKFPASEPIYTITDKALNQALTMTLADVERAIVTTLIDLLGKDANANAVAARLDVSHGRIDKYFPRTSLVRPTSPAPGNNIIFRVKAAAAFSRPLDATLDAVEKAVKQAAFIHHRGNIKAAIRALHVNWNRFNA